MLTLVVAVCAAATVAAQATEDLTARCRSLLKLYLDGKHEEFLAASNEQVQAGLTVEQMQQVQSQLGAALGAYVGEADAKTTPIPSGGGTVVFTLRHERGFVDMSVSIDEQQRVSGFWARNIKPLEEAKPPAYADASKFDESDVTVKSGEFELPGKLCLPKNDAKAPAVVLVHGSGAHDADETVFGTKVFRDVAWGLASRGVAVLRYEKRNHKYGAQLDPLTTTLESETIDDAVAAVKLLRERPEIDPKRVYVLGHSLGALAAPYIAAADPQIAGIVVMAGSGRPLREVVIEQIDYITRSDGSVSPEEQQALDETKAAVAKLASGKFGDDDKLLNVPLKYWADLDKHDGPKQAATLSCPIYVIQGGRDYQITMKCFEQWRKALNGKPKATLKVYEKLNHLMVAGDAVSTPSEYFTPGNVDQAVVDDVAAWIRD
jgi:dienelactone hydrolase